MIWKNIVFDFDGVIAINSQQVAFEVFTEELQALGVSITVDEMFGRYGRINAMHIPLPCRSFVNAVATNIFT
jgi:beta-phosphoglucomutase-like phosphatase (HAD superfamily)